MKAIRSLLHKSQITDSSSQPSSSTSSNQPRRSKDLPREPLPSTSTITPSTATAHYNPTAATTTGNKQQSTTASTMGPSGNAKEQAESLVKRENEAKARRDRATYEGLPDGLVLGIKMGDGAFSNVFQATLRPNAAQLAIDPTLGKSVKVAVKCVRKFELSHSQVRPSLLLVLLLYLFSRLRQERRQWGAPGCITISNFYFPLQISFSFTSCQHYHHSHLSLAATSHC